MKDFSETIEYLAQRIVEEINPLRIMLFGSAARGETGADSEIPV